MGDPNRQLTAAEEGVLRRLRRIYGPLGGVVEERDKFGHVSIRVGKKTLAMLGLNDGVPSLGLKSDLTTQALLVETRWILPNALRRPARVGLDRRDGEADGLAGHRGRAGCDLPSRGPQAEGGFKGSEPLNSWSRVS